MTRKTCSNCQQDLPADRFYTDKTKKTGLSSRCRECQKTSALARYHSDPESAKEKNRAWRAANPDRYAKTHKNGTAAQKARRRGGVVVEIVDLDFVWERDRGVCGVCGEPADHTKWDLDHIVPIARGGVHSYENVRVTHPSCNRKRRDH